MSEVKRQLAYIENYLFNVEDYKLLGEGRTNNIFLINNTYVVKFTANKLDEIFEWYFANSRFSPRFVFADDQSICYQYVASTGRLKRSHVIDLLTNYHPATSSVCFKVYINELEGQYKLNKQQLNLQDNSYFVPPKRNMYKCHGDMGMHNTVISDERIVQIDPEPIAAIKEHDLFAFFLSKPNISELVPLKQFQAIVGIEDEEEFYYYFKRHLAEKMCRCKSAGDKDYQFYANLWNQIV